MIELLTLIAVALLLFILFKAIRRSMWKVNRITPQSTEILSNWTDGGGLNDYLPTEKEPSIPPELQKVLTKEEKKSLVSQWKKVESERRKMQREKDMSELLDKQKEVRMQRDFPMVSPREQSRRLYEAERSILIRKYGKKTALEMLGNGHAGGTAKPIKPYTPVRNTNKSGWIYVIQDKTTGLYKIGRTKNIDRRMKELGVGKSARLIKRKFVADCHKAEKDLHQRYKSQRLPQTEYFKLKTPPMI